MTTTRRCLLGCAALVLSVALVGCKKNQSSNGNGGTPNGSNQAPTAQGPVTVALQAQNNSGISGTATIADVNGKARITIQYTGGPGTTPQPAHIHTGSCSAIGAVMYPLTSPVNGASVTTLNISLAQLLKEKPWAINVHKSVAEANIYVACGDQTVAAQ